MSIARQAPDLKGLQQITPANFQNFLGALWLAFNYDDIDHVKKNVLSRWLVFIAAKIEDLKNSDSPFNLRQYELSFFDFLEEEFNNFAKDSPQSALLAINEAAKYVLTKEYDFENISKTLEALIYSKGRFSVSDLPVRKMRMLHEIGILFQMAYVLEYATFDSTMNRVTEILDLHDLTNTKKIADGLTASVQQQSRFLEKLAEKVQTLENAWLVSYNQEAIKEALKNAELNIIENYDSFLQERIKKLNRDDKPLKFPEIKHLQIFGNEKNDFMEPQLKQLKIEIETKMAFAQGLAKRDHAEKEKIFTSMEIYHQDIKASLDNLELNVASGFKLPSPPDIKTKNFKKNILIATDARQSALQELQYKYQPLAEQMSAATKILNNEIFFPRERKDDVALITGVKQLKPVYDTLGYRDTKELIIRAKTAARNQSTYSVSKEWENVASETDKLKFDRIQCVGSLAQEIFDIDITEKAILSQIKQEQDILLAQRSAYTRLKEIPNEHNRNRITTLQANLDGRRTNIQKLIQQCKEELSKLNFFINAQIQQFESKKQEEKKLLPTAKIKKISPKNTSLAIMAGRPKPIKPFAPARPKLLAPINADFREKKKALFSGKEKGVIFSSLIFGAGGLGVGLCGLFGIGLLNIWNPLGWIIIAGVSGISLLSGVAYFVGKKYCCNKSVSSSPNFSTSSEIKPLAYNPRKTAKNSKDFKKEEKKSLTINEQINQLKQEIESGYDELSVHPNLNIIIFASKSKFNQQNYYQAQAGVDTKASGCEDKINLQFEIKLKLLKLDIISKIQALPDSVKNRDQAINAVFQSRFDTADYLLKPSRCWDANKPERRKICQELNEGKDIIKKMRTSEVILCDVNEQLDRVGLRM